MTRVRKFLSRSPAERRLLLCTLVLYVVVSVLLTWVSFGRLRRWGARLSTAREARPCDAAREQAVVWAVSTAAVVIALRDSCLAEALTAHWLLAASGRASIVRIGIAPAAGRPFTAHAWLESQGRAVLGAPDGSAYLTLE